MPYRLRDDLSFCRVDGHLIFLDIQSDQYFRLSQRMERAFVAYLEAGDERVGDTDGLVTSRILVEAPRLAGDTTSSITPPTRSLVEHADRTPPTGGGHGFAVFETLAIVCSTQWQLKARSLKDTLNRMKSYRRRKAPEAGSFAIDSLEQRLSEAATAFGRTRPYVPIETCCLVDSISMARFLARRGLYATVVFGVNLDPFSAHCWVQVQDIVVNDTIGNVAAHTPILGV